MVENRHSSTRSSFLAPRCWSVLLGLVSLVGCQSMSMPSLWPFPEHERTTYHTPQMRIDAIKQIATKSTGTDSPEQRQLTDELARQIQIEPDPLVRTAVVNAIAEFRTPMAQQVLEAGLEDASRPVRIACCRALGQRGEASSVRSLSQVLKQDKDLDVRLTAAEALGKIHSPESVQALVTALEDRDPAMQYVGVQSMKTLTGKDYGGDVDAWRQLATGQAPPPPQAPSIAERLRSMSPL
jgi:HEAT repeat protein